jgi:hypothetical protein
MYTETLHSSILDPLLFSLLSPKMIRQPAKLTISGLEVDVEQYQHVFDMAQAQYVLENLLSLASFGGQGFTRLAKTSYVKQSPYSGLKSRAEASMCTPQRSVTELTYCFRRNR